jgi:Zn-dependent protease with chaperone function
LDFYAQQDQARRNSTLLVALFLVAVLLLIGITNVLIAAILFFGGFYGLPFAGDQAIESFLAGFNLRTFGMVSLGVISTILLVVLFKWAQLAAGGKAVAERLGGSRILPDTDDPEQRRCLNVVEEMSLAAGLPVPPVYLLASERGINAFAAGVSPADAVIGITQGSLSRFNRAQLQGVIAHEFSHILNGDMRLNIRLAALLKGITFIGDVGEVLVRGGRNRGRSYEGSRKMPGQVLAAGVALWLIGWLGGLFAGFIKAAVSRQREYLADASAVQFTRNPRGIADALRVIGGHVPGTVVVESRAIELSHIFFGQIADSLWQVFATHPPLEERIRRVDPGWDGSWIMPAEGAAYLGTAADRARAEREAEEERRAASVVTTATLAGSLLGEPAGDFIRRAAEDAEFPYLPPPPSEVLPLELYQRARDPFSAMAIVLALLMGRGGRSPEAQLEQVEQAGVRGLATTTRQMLAMTDTLPSPLRLPLVELSLPALKCMSGPQYRVFKDTLLRVIRADQRIDLYEWCLYQVTRHYLDPEFVRVRPARPRYRRAVHVSSQVRCVMSVLAWHGHSDDGERRAGFTRGVQALGLYNLTLQPLAECSVVRFGEAVTVLADCYPLLKPRLLKAMALCAGQDGKLASTEREILVAVAAVMDCPVPARVRLGLDEPDLSNPGEREPA